MDDDGTAMTCKGHCSVYMASSEEGYFIAAAAFLDNEGNEWRRLTFTERDTLLVLFVIANFKVEFEPVV